MPRSTERGSRFFPTIASVDSREPTRASERPPECGESARSKGDGNVGWSGVVSTNVGDSGEPAGRLLAYFSKSAGENPQLAHRNDVFSDNRGPRRAMADISGMQRTVGDAEASKRVRSERMARRPNAAVGVVCPRCGMLAARIIGRSESLPVIYLTCEDCGRTSVAPSGEQA